MAIKDWIKTAEDRLDEAGSPTPRLDAQVLACYGLNMSKTALTSHDSDIITREKAHYLNTLLERRLKREPIAYITGSKEFYGLKFHVNPNVLIPRPTTEDLVDAVLQHVPAHSSLLEVGTGSGCVAISIHKSHPTLHVTATDISPTALLVASRNALDHRARIQFIESDLFNKVESRYAAIVSNLPYVPNNRSVHQDLTYEPAQAIYSGDDGLNHYRQFFMQAKRHLLPGGIVIVEAEPSQKAELANISKKVGLKMSDYSDFITVYS